jgi:hypothetical protein
MDIDLYSKIFPNKYTSCLGYCVYKVAKHHSIDPINVLIQPWGFSFEVELTSKDWWLLGYTEQHFQNISFPCGLKGKWLTINSSDILDLIKTNLLNNKWIIFQTEWFKVPYSPHFQKRQYDIHTAIITEIDETNKRIKISDRMLLSNSYRDESWIDYNQLLDAFSDRFKVLDYEIFNYNFDDKLLHTIVTSSLEECCSEESTYNWRNGVNRTTYSQNV